MSAIRYELDQTLARITLTRPDRSNAFDRDAAAQLHAAVDRAGADGARAVLLCGEGARFCAGGDLASMAAADDPPAYLRVLATELAAAFEALSALPIPVVAAVHGAAAGAGIGLALSADVVVAARSTVFVAAYAGVGFTPDCGVSYLLSRAVGHQRAIDLLITGRVLPAEEAERWGLITRVVEDGEHLAAAEALARRLSEGPTEALAQTIDLVRDGWHSDRHDLGIREADTIAQLLGQPDARRRVEAFLAKSR